MADLLLPSIKMQDIDRDNCYFNPGCALSLYKPEAAEKVLTLLRAHFGPVRMHQICCHHQPGLPAGSTIINNCAGCDRRFRSLYPGINTISLWEVLDSLPHLPLPDHQGLTLSVHDSCSYRPKPQVHAAVRSMLDKMHIKIVESAYRGTKSICCGDNFYPRLPADRVNELQKKRAAQMPCGDVAVYCISCIKSMTVGGKKARYMVDLLLNEETVAGDTDLTRYHRALDRYIEEH